jgi:hypothetical protein
MIKTTSDGPGVIVAVGCSESSTSVLTAESAGKNNAGAVVLGVLAVGAKAVGSVVLGVLAGGVNEVGGVELGVEAGGVNGVYGGGVSISASPSEPTFLRWCWRCNRAAERACRPLHARRP